MSEHYKEKYRSRDRDKDKYRDRDKERNKDRDKDSQVLKEMDSKQKESQGLYIRDSHNIQVTQTEIQGLLLIQAALQATLEASIVVLGSEDKDVRQLQKVAENLEAAQKQYQTIVIENSKGIKVTQTEVQVEVVVQAAINLLAQLLLKIEKSS
ncbi:spore coat protein [Bacillus sp. FJAT-49736]|uniref:spore coat protein n=1 Tax=Bacillus sp. FJAT-49736 TaxID=2833582 RepID=UPI001BC8F71B|nr:spore coat protein [Bacillus sp. FJAT-49736]MBS4171711.1 spore coat protein [Bacillus sp. FJAT-49736]